MQTPSFATLLDHFAGPWLAAGAAAGPTLYVDAFAGAGWQLGAGAEGASVDAALRVAAGGAAVVLIEEDPVLAARLQAAVRGAGRTLSSADPADLAAGDVLVLQADFAAVADLVAAVPMGTRTLLAAAPPSARRLSWRLLEAFLADPASELLLRFPVLDLVRQDAHTGPLADLPPFARRVVDGCSALIDDGRHGWLASWRATRRTYGLDAAFEETMQRFAQRLDVASGDRITKAIHLAGEQGGVRVFLVTAHPLAALALNSAVLEAGARPCEPRSAHPVAGGPPRDLFGAPLPDSERRDDPAGALAEHWYARHRGSSVVFRELLPGLAGGGATLADARRALGLLRRGGRAVYPSLRSLDAEVVFPGRPSPPPPRRAPGKHLSGEGDLFTGS